MPNWCNNVLDIEFKKEQDYVDFRRRFEEDTTDRFFERFVEAPRDLAPDQRYDWNVENYGTKWDVPIQEIGTAIDITAPSIRLAFDTAWSPPSGFLKSLSALYPTAIMLLSYVEEGMAYMGKYEAEGGKITLDIYQNIEPVDYAEAGAVMTEDGYVDWELTDDYDLMEIALKL